MSDDKEKVGLIRRLFGFGGKRAHEETLASENGEQHSTDDEALLTGDLRPETVEIAEAIPAADAEADIAPDPVEILDAQELIATGEPDKAAIAEDLPPEAVEVLDEVAPTGIETDIDAPSEAEVEAETEVEAEVVSTDAAVDAPPAKRNWFQRLTDGLRKSSQSLSSGITDIFTKRKLDEDTLQDLEDILIQADLGIDAATRIAARVGSGRYNKQIDPDEVKSILAAEVAEVLRPVAQPLEIDRDHRPFVIMMVGVNGTGKTTTIGKMSAQFRQEGRKVMLAAGDTFRAAAVEQLKVWGERVGAPVLSKDIGADAAGLAFEALQRAKADNVDVLMIDTAGRLQNKSDLMAELQKIVRVLRKQDETAPHAVLLVLDATTGQNAINQVQIFQQIAGVTGLVMTKLDGTARGGILVAVAEKFGLPIHAIGVGEGIADLQPFEADEFARSIAGIH